jgi:hypothetical protein
MEVGGEGNQPIDYIAQFSIMHGIVGGILIPYNFALVKSRSLCKSVPLGLAVKR